MSLGHIRAVVVLILILISPLKAGKITDATNQRLENFFNTLGHKTNWYFALEQGDDDQKARELADKLESSQAAAIVSGQIWDQNDLIRLLDGLHVFQIRVDAPLRCIDLQYNLPIIDRTFCDLEESFCDPEIGDIDLLMKQSPDHYNINKALLKMNAKGKDYLMILKKYASFDYRLVTLSGQPSRLSNPEVRVLSEKSTLFGFLNSFSLTQKHSNILYMAYFIHNQEQRVDIYIEK